MSKNSVEKAANPSSSPIRIVQKMFNTNNDVELVRMEYSNIRVSVLCFVAIGLSTQLSRSVHLKTVDHVLTVDLLKLHISGV